MSTSKPMVLPLSSLDWNGAYGRWVQTVRVPGRMSETAASDPFDAVP